MFYHLKTRHCVKTVHMVSELRLREKGLITKKHILMYMHLNFVFKQALHSVH